MAWGFETKKRLLWGYVFQKAKESGLYEERGTSVVDTPMGISEKMIGRLFFLTVDGVFDYNGLTVVDERSHKFVEDLFDYYWKRASDRTPEWLMEALLS